MFDEDSHADMHCAGKNCVMLATSGYTCDVSPFHDSYAPQRNIEIVRAATAYQDPSGATIYIIMNTALWFGNRMEHSLFNGMLARDAGVDLCTNTRDPHRAPGLYLGDQPFSQQLCVPLLRQGNKLGVRTFKPTRDEVLLAMDTNSSNVMYLNPEESYTPATADVYALQLQHEDDEPDLRPRIQDLPLDVQATYENAAAPSDEAPLFWGHQIHEVLANKVNAGATTEDGSDQPPTMSTGTGNSSFPGLSLVGTTARRHRGPVTPELLHRQWGIGLETARNTIDTTTQLAIRGAVHPLRRRYRTDLLSLHYRRFDTTVYTDTIFSKYTSREGNTCAQVFGTEGGYLAVYPMKSKSEAGSALTTFVQDVGIPNRIHCDNAPEMVEPGTDFMKTVNYYKIKHTTTEAHTPRQNRIEPITGALRRRFLHMCAANDIPKRLWDYGLKWNAETYSRTYRGSNKCTGYEQLTGDTPDISEYTDFSFYDKVWYWDTPSSQEPAKPGRWLGVSHRVGSSLCYFILTSKAKVISRTTVQPVPDLELSLDVTVERFKKLDENIRKALNDDNFVINGNQPHMLYLEDTDDAVEEPLNPDGAFLADVDVVDGEGDGYDEYINAEMNFDLGGDNEMRGVVIKRAKGEDGNVIGTRHSNPMLDTRRYQVRFTDGSHQELAANLIAENLYSQVNEHGHQQLIFKEIDGLRHIGTAKPDTAPTDGNQEASQAAPKKTTAGWEVRVQWKDGASSWLPMVEVKDSNPIELAEFAILNGKDKEPAFAWWIPHALRTRRRMISKVKSKYWRTTHKFGIRVPKTVDEAYAIDKENGNDVWHKSIEKEMVKIRAAMKEFDGDEHEARRKLVGYQKIRCHIIFDVKMEGLVRKSRFVAGGHTTETPKSLTYASVVTRESVRLAFLVAALNDLNVLAADVGNAYLNADCREKIYFIAGSEFGSKKGKVLIIKKALYGLKSSGAAWRALFASTLTELGYKPSDADPDVWLKPAVKPDGYEYYDMILVYVDDILHVSHYKSYDEDPVMQEIGRIYQLKDGSVKPPTLYLGANVGSAVDDQGKKMWFLSASDYIDAVVKTVESSLPPGTKLRGKAERPFVQSYRPELDATPFLDEDGIRQYQGYIGILRWTVELCRVDIMTEVSLLSSYLVAPREGHLQAALSIFAYLRKHKDQAMFFNPHNFTVDESKFTPVEEWKSLYGDINEELPPNAPPPRGAPITLTALVDADHASNRVTRRSQAGFVIYGNCAPLLWFSKKMATIETSTFGSEFVALRLCVESIIAMRYKLRMFGIPVDGPTSVFCDNESVVNSSSNVAGRLSKKHLAICYHRVRECCAQGICRITHIHGEENTADLFTKVLPTPRRTMLIQKLLRYFKTH